MDFSNIDVILNNRDEYGVIAKFNNQPCLAIFKAYTMQLNKFDENGKAKNDSYSIVKTFTLPADSKLTMQDILHKGFNAEEALISNQ